MEIKENMRVSVETRNNCEHYSQGCLTIIEEMGKNGGYKGRFGKLSKRPVLTSGELGVRWQKGVSRLS